MEIVIENPRKFKILPDSDFVKELARLTEGNRHIEANAKIADWCIENGEKLSLDSRKRFEYFKDYFIRLHDHLKEVISAPFQEVAYLMGKEMDNLIAETFGQETLNALNEGR